MLKKPQADFAPVETMMMQGLAFQVLQKSLELKLFDSLDRHFKTPVQIAGEFSFSERAVTALLNMLTANGFLKKEGDSYCNSVLASEYLVSSSPFYQLKSLMLHDRFNASILENFEPLFRGGHDGKAQVDDGWGAEDTMLGTAQHAMLGGLQDTVSFITKLPGFDSMEMMGDIGGNHGEFCMAVLDANPNLDAQILDLPNVVETVNQRIFERGYAERLQAIGYDLQSDRLLENRYDLLLASHVLYGFVDQLEELAGMIHAALRPGGWFVAQHLSPNNELPAAYVSALEFVTCLAGYKSHFLGQKQLETALTRAGFDSFSTATTGLHGAGLIVAAQKADKK